MSFECPAPFWLHSGLWIESVLFCKRLFCILSKHIDAKRKENNERQHKTNSNLQKSGWFKRSKQTFKDKNLRNLSKSFCSCWLTRPPDVAIWRTETFYDILSFTWFPFALGTYRNKRYLQDKICMKTDIWISFFSIRHDENKHILRSDGSGYEVEQSSS